MHFEYSEVTKIRHAVLAWSAVCLLSFSCAGPRLVPWQANGRPIKAVAANGDGSVIGAGGSLIGEKVRERLGIWENRVLNQSILLETDGIVESIALIAEGAYVFAGGEFSGVIGYRIEPTVRSIHIGLNGAEVSALANCERNKILAVAGAVGTDGRSGFLRLFDLRNVDSGEVLELRTVNIPGAFSVRRLQFSENCEYIAGITGESVLRWSADGLKDERIVPLRNLSAGALSPSGRKIIVANAYGDLILLDLDADQTKKFEKAHDGYVYSVMFLDNGTLLTSAEDGGLKRWLVNDKVKLSKSVRATGDVITVVSAYRDSLGAKLVTGDTQGQLRIWDASQDNLRIEGL